MKTIKLRAMIGNKLINSTMACVFSKEGVQGVYCPQDYELTLTGDGPVDVPALCAHLKAGLEECGIACRSVEPL